MPEEAPYAVRFTLPALDDLRSLARRDPQIVRAVLANVQILERNPYAGRPLDGRDVRRPEDAALATLALRARDQRAGA